MAGLQEVIHKIEVGGGMRPLRKGVILLVLLLLLVGYNWRGFKNMATQEAMDAAQLARNIAQGHGYTTLFIRPFSMFLVKRHNEAKGSALDPAKAADLSQLKTGHPDLANPPAYPLLLAGLMKVLPFDYAASASKAFWSYEGRFWRYQPDFLISLFNQLLFFGVVALVFLVARRLFDNTVAFLSALLTLGTELFWRFSVSGLSTMLLMLLFLGVVWCLMVIEAEAREPKGGLLRLFLLALVTGLLVGLGALTRYSFAWLLLPVLVFLVLFAGHQRVLVAVVAFVVFAAVFTPWVVRNYSVSGTPFGTAGYAVYETPGSFSEYHLERSLQPDLSHSMPPLLQKLTSNIRQIVPSDLPRFTGSWLGAFFLVGLLVGFRDPAVTRLRYFLVACLVLFACIQALVRTQLSEDSPEINSENLLVVFAPLILIYGVSLFYLLLDQIEMPIRELRYAAVVLFGIIACLPMILSFLPPRTTPLAYPPYYPPVLQVAADWTRPDELTASDMPWAMAWYGRRQSVWVANPVDFFAINDFQKPIQTLYLTRLTLDSRFETEWILPGEQAWGGFVFQAIPYLKDSSWPKRIDFRVRQSADSLLVFPLHYWQSGWPEQFLLTAREHSPNAQ